jgi:hypothetical protein
MHTSYNMPLLMAIAVDPARADIFSAFYFIKI